MGTQTKKVRQRGKQQALPNNNENSQKIDELAKIQRSLGELVPKEDPNASLLAVRFLIQHKHEFPALDQMMAESLRNEGERRNLLVNTVTSNMSSIVRGFNFREILKVLIVGLYALCASVGGLYLIITGKNVPIGAGLLASPFVGGLLKSMFLKKK